MQVVAIDVAFGWGEGKAEAANKTPIKQNADRTGKQVGRQQTSGEERKKQERKGVCAYT